MQIVLQADLSVWPAAQVSGFYLFSLDADINILDPKVYIKINMVATTIARMDTAFGIICYSKLA